MDLHQPVADKQRRSDPGLDRLFVLAANDEAVDHGFHLRVGRCGVAGLGVPASVLGLRLDSLGEVHRLTVDEHPATALLSHLGEQDVEILTIDREDRSPELDLGAFRERQDGFKNLTR